MVCSPAGLRQALADRVAGLRAQAIAGQAHGEGRPGAAAESDLRERAQILRQAGDAERLVPALPDAGVGVRVDVAVDAQR